MMAVDSAQTKFCIGSVIKPMTAFAVAQLDRVLLIQAFTHFLAYT